MQQGHGARAATKEFDKFHRLLHKNLGQNKLSFGVFCIVLLSQEPQPVADANASDARS